MEHQPDSTSDQPGESAPSSAPMSASEIEHSIQYCQVALLIAETYEEAAVSGRAPFSPEVRQQFAGISRRARRASDAGFAELQRQGVGSERLTAATPTHSPSGRELYFSPRLAATARFDYERHMERMNLGTDRPRSNSQPAISPVRRSSEADATSASPGPARAADPGQESGSASPASSPASRQPSSDDDLPPLT